jgi:hypothetical protein
MDIEEFGTRLDELDLELRQVAKRYGRPDRPIGLLKARDTLWLEFVSEITTPEQALVKIRMGFLEFITGEEDSVITAEKFH